MSASSSRAAAAAGSGVCHCGKFDAAGDLKCKVCHGTNPLAYGHPPAVAPDYKGELFAVVAEDSESDDDGEDEEGDSHRAADAQDPTGHDEWTRNSQVGISRKVCSIMISTQMMEQKRNDRQELIEIISGLFRWLNFKNKGEDYSNLQLSCRDLRAPVSGAFEMVTKTKTEEEEEKDMRLVLFEHVWIAICRCATLGKEYGDLLAGVKLRFEKGLMAMRPPPSSANILKALRHRLRLQLLGMNHPFHLKLKFVLLESEMSHETGAVYQREVERVDEEKKRQNPLYAAEKKRYPIMYECDRDEHDRKDPLLEYVYDLKMAPFECLCQSAIANLQHDVYGYKSFVRAASWFLHWKQVYDELIGSYPVVPLRVGMPPVLLDSMCGNFKGYVFKRRHIESSPGADNAWNKLLLDLFSPVGVVEFYRRVHESDAAQDDRPYLKIQAMVNWLESSRALCDALTITVANLSNIKTKQFLDGAEGPDILDTFWLFQFTQVFVYYVRSEGGFSPYLILHPYIYTRRRELTKVLYISTPRCELRPKIFTVGGRIFVKDVYFDATTERHRGTFYECGSFLEACMAWLYFVQIHHESQLEEEISVRKLINQVIPPPPDADDDEDEGDDDGDVEMT